MKKIVIAAFCFLIALNLAACGNDKQTVAKELERSKEASNRLLEGYTDKGAPPKKLSKLP